MALKDDILARKLTKPRRQPRPGPTIDQDGAVHYRVFDEPRAEPALDLHNQNADKAPSITPILDTPETQVVIDTKKVKLAVEKVLPITPLLSTEEVVKTSVPASSLQTRSSFAARLDSVDPLSAELMISGIALDILRVLITFVQDATSGVTTPVFFETLHASSGVNKSSLRKTIQRLEKKGVIERVKFKDGIGGWTQYKICNYQNIMEILKAKT